MNPTHGALNPQLLGYSRKVANHVGAEGPVINCGCVHRMLPEEVVVEGQVSQHDRDAALQGETPVRVPSLGKLNLQVGQGVKM